MTIEEIRKKAPVGATHYKANDNHVSYFRINHEYRFFWNVDSWSATYIDILSFTKPL